MKLSIITINYNNKAGLQNTIDSVMSQTWRDFEWIIIDGGSTDGSKEVIESVASDPNSNISYWCSEPDKGIYNAMNKGIVRTSGEYLNFMNSGDCYYENNTLEKIKQYLDDDEADIFFGDVMTKHTRKNKRIYPIDMNPLEIAINYAFFHQGSFIKTALQKTNPYDEQFKIASDWKFFLFATEKKNAKCKFIDMVVCLMDESGISSNNEMLLSQERHEILNDLFGKNVIQEIRKYYYLKNISIVANSEYLRLNHPKMYVLCRRIISIFTKICKRFK